MNRYEALSFIWTNSFKGMDGEDFQVFREIVLSTDLSCKKDHKEMSSWMGRKFYKKDTRFQYCINKLTMCLIKIDLSLRVLIFNRGDSLKKALDTFYTKAYRAYKIFVVEKEEKGGYPALFEKINMNKHQLQSLEVEKVTLTRKIEENLSEKQELLQKKENYDNQILEIQTTSNLAQEEENLLSEIRKNKNAYDGQILESEKAQNLKNHASPILETKSSPSNQIVTRNSEDSTSSNDENKKKLTEMLAPFKIGNIKATFSKSKLGFSKKERNEKIVIKDNSEGQKVTRISSFDANHEVDLGPIDGTNNENKSNLFEDCTPEDLENYISNAQESIKDNNNEIANIDKLNKDLTSKLTNLEEKLKKDTQAIDEVAKRCEELNEKIKYLEILTQNIFKYFSESDQEVYKHAEETYVRKTSTLTNSILRQSIPRSNFSKHSPMASLNNETRAQQGLDLDQRDKLVQKVHQETLIENEVENAHLEAFLKDINDKLHKDFGSIWKALFKNLESQKEKHHCIKEWNLEKNGKFSLLLNDCYKVGIQPMNEKEEPDPEGGIVLTFNKEIAGRIDAKEKMMYFESGLSLFCKPVVGFFRINFDGYVYSLSCSENEEMIFLAGNSVKKQSTKTSISKLRKEWSNGLLVNDADTFVSENLKKKK